MPRDSSRRPALDGLRGLAALAIVAHHAWQYSGHPAAGLGIWWNELALGVPLFFCLSGFLVYAPWARAAVDPAARPPRLGRYAALRAVRILPLYWLTLVVAVLVLHGTGHWRLVEDWRLVGFAVLAQNYSGDLAGMLNPPTWSLAVEATFYAVVPLIGLLALRVARVGRGRRSLRAALGRPVRPAAPGRTGQLAVLAAITGAGIAWTAWTGHTAASPVVRTVLPDVIGLFCVGMVARVLVEGRTVPRWLARVLLVAGAALVWAHGSGRLGVPLDGILGDLPAGVGFAAICVACSTADAPRALGWRPLASLGACSYGIYLWHYPVLLGLQAHGLLPADDLLATCVLVGGPAILAAMASYHLVELPLLRATRRRLARETDRRPAPASRPRRRTTVPARPAA